MKPAEPRFIRPALGPAAVHIAVSTRVGGVSTGRHAGLNLGDHVGDDPAAVARNRALLRVALALPGEPQWLRQVHGTTVVDARADGVVREGDAAWTDVPGVVCAVLTADCLPVVISSMQGREVAVAHCGWRGLAAGILARTVHRFRADATSLCAWLGPAIGPQAFEVGAEVREAFLHDAEEPAPVAAAFRPHPTAPGKYLADLFELARIALFIEGVSRVSGGGICTVRDPARFYSYRRDGETGRFATLAWIDPAQGSGTKAP